MIQGNQEKSEIDVRSRRMGKREEITDVSRVLKMLGQGWVGREHPSLSETREEEENAQMLWRRGLRCLNDSCFLEERGIIYQRCPGGGASSVIGRSFKGEENAEWRGACVTL